MVATGSMFLSSCLFATSSTTVKGTVTNGENPIEGAEVFFDGHETGKTSTDKEGRFTVTVAHRPTQMLRLQVNKEGYAMREKIEFPGFAAPDEPVEIELVRTIPRKR